MLDLNKPELLRWKTDPLSAFVEFIQSADFAKTSLVKRRKERLSEQSMNVYRAMFSRFVTYINTINKTILDVTAEDIYIFLTATDETKSGKKLVLESDIQNRYLRLLERIFTHLECRPRPTDNINLGRLKEHYQLRGRDKQTVALTDVEIRAFLSCLPAPMAKERSGRLSANWKKKRDRALQCIVLGAGLTVTEVIYLKVDAIDSALQLDGSLGIKIHDSEPENALVNTHITYMHSELVPELQAWLRERHKLFPGGTLIFPGTTGQPLDKATVYRQIRKTFESAGIELPRRGGRGLRNTFAIREIQSGTESQELLHKMGLYEERSLEIYNIAAALGSSTL